MQSKLDEKLRRLENRHLKRQLRAVKRKNGEILIGQKKLINLASNDYLGLANDRRLIEASKIALEKWGVGSGASRLLAGNFPIHEELEEKISEFKQTEASLVFSSGYAANLGVLTALATPRDYIYLDELVHASLRDGARLSGANIRYFRHLDVNHLEKQLSENPSRGERFVVTDGVFSMDGDIAPLSDIVRVCEKYDATLIVDDAHGTGVIGPEGKGTVSYFKLEDRVPIQIGTLSKALGVQGGFVTGSKKLIEFLIQRARSFIYSTGLSPTLAAAAIEALKIAQKEEWRRHSISNYRRKLTTELKQKGYKILGHHEAPMLAVVVGEAEKAVNLAKQLEEHGVYAPAIRPPTVPLGTSRIRLAPIAVHSTEQIETVVESFPNQDEN
ncbi:MAG: 8-amino-7-oxononanoate synthase [Pyrinomonadaceae bacterium]|nr:8-amino-7-oxononanoate synthase [Pyrinomonadaceae bacterium]MCX7640030.1 8-amino-7-oxononanoate synthase [Pyrinomonadaceae bacterium]MDW8304202.1 8-amino-7-oxononanoate synthase [Acidobacteriota bacterium]